MTDRPHCAVCETLPPGDLLELDVVVGDPLRWPATLWGILPAPVNGLPASYRRHGAYRMGSEWLDAHGYSGAFSAQALRRHIRYDVPVQQVDMAKLIESGLVVRRAELPPVGHTSTPIDPLAFVTLYDKGIKLGIKGFESLARQVDAILDRGDEVPLKLVKQLTDAGIRLATSQATIKAAGKPFGDADLDENSAFMGRDVSPRMGHSRVRVIDGERRPVVDEGKADRDHYNERAAQEGGVRIGGR